jgi:hypothetical protein
LSSTACHLAKPGGLIGINVRDVLAVLHHQNVRDVVAVIP